MRSGQSRMWKGLPLRTTNTTGERRRVEHLQAPGDDARGDDGAHRRGRGAHVGEERECDHVRVEAVDHGPRLASRAAVGLPDHQLPARFVGILRDELLIQIGKKLTRRVV